MRAVNYLRVSTDDQSLGIETQRASCQKYCQDHGIEIAGEYIDEGLGGALQPKDRPSLMAAIGSLRKGDILLVAKRDRIARCDRAISKIEEAVEEKKARIISARDEGTWSLDQDDVQAYMMRSMSDMFAKAERLTIKARTKAALAVKKAKGERVGHVPFGFRLSSDGIHIEEDDNEQAIIKLIHELNDSGMSVRKIAKELNNRKISNRGAIWSKSSTHRVIQKAA